jgi:hypothetical protein
MWAVASYATTFGSLGLAYLSTSMNLLPSLAVAATAPPLAGLLVPTMICTGIVAAGTYICENLINKNLRNEYYKLTTYQLQFKAAGVSMSREAMLIQALQTYRVVTQPPFYAGYLKAELFDRETNSPGVVMGRPLLQAMRIIVANWDKLGFTKTNSPADRIAEETANGIREQYDKQIALLLGSERNYAREFQGALARVNELPEFAQTLVGKTVGYVGFPVSVFFWGAFKLLW